ncbi:SAF domain family protein [Bacillus cereus]|uniref:AAA family ATPase n=1 Tax=Bacillus wiedmannii TaxID=1890302 RepID=UPI0008180C67|nr:AAA family ATPase [Bacillus wiedmannii]WMS85415.1 AAA family ATPase [Bacillus wiedmannii]SCC24906.1 SAF domain family protein [Bacillus cereus]
MERQVKVIAFYATNENVGKSTLSIAMANELAHLGKKVLYVEADQVRPSFAICTGISHDSKNMLELVKKENDYNLLEYICTKQDLIEKKLNSKFITKLHNKMDILVFPSGYNKAQFPEIQSKELFVTTFIESMLDTEYDYIILSVPNELSEVLSYPVLYQSDLVINVLNSNPRGSLAIKRELQLIEEAKLTLPRMIHVLNMEDEDYAEDVEKLSSQKIAVTIPYDRDRTSYEWGMQFGSPIINARVNQLMEAAGLDIPSQHTSSMKKGLFGLRN